ncbi:hypothetical protein O181_103687 [Austropuccinia psidii MF-1]|uniref:Uncharacterized protein n=1 Tax=Austropuccinia psidii MF-1 TaxID=1389203 RepID=A0A9Q3JLM4_9BASI|nr:hypothetical protein [Austropuccinia psidii MF-1]
MKHDLIDVLYTYNNSCSSGNAHLGAIKVDAFNVTLNIDRPYPPEIRRPAYPTSPRARGALEKHVQEFIQLGVPRNVGYNEEFELTTPAIIAWHDDISRIVEILKH